MLKDTIFRQYGAIVKLRYWERASKSESKTTASFVSIQMFFTVPDSLHGHENIYIPSRMENHGEL